MREIIALHMGQAGVQLGHAIWELACLEHCVSPTGEFNAACCDGRPSEGLESVFLECRNGNYCPRALLLDLEPTVIDEVRTGAYRQLFNPVNLISGKQDAASNYARAYFAQSHIHLPNIRERLRVLCEQCDALTCFQLCYSANGGTGSGLTAALCDELSDLYAKKFKFATSIYPSPSYSEITVEPYNALLHTATTVDLCDCVVLADNEAVHRAISRKLGEQAAGFSLPNRVLARLINAQFLCHRYNFLGQQRVEVTDLLTNLVPFPRVHFPTMAFAPFVRREALALDNFNATQLLSQIFYNDDCQLASINAANQPYIACAVLCRGAVTPCDVVEAVKAAKLSDRTRFVDWCPTGFKIGTNSSPPISMPTDCPLKVGDRCLAMIASNVGVRDAWYTTRRHFDLLFNKRAFVHWYVSEGMEEGEFTEAADVISSIIQDYEDVGRELKAGGRAEEEPDDVTSTDNHAVMAAPAATMIASAVSPRARASSTKQAEKGDPRQGLPRPSTVFSKNYRLKPAVGAMGEDRSKRSQPGVLATVSTLNDLRLTSSSSGGRPSLTEGSHLTPTNVPEGTALSYGEVQTMTYASVLQHLQDLSGSTDGDRRTPSEEELFSQAVAYRQRRSRQPSFRSRRIKLHQQSPEVHLPLVGHPLVSWAEEVEPDRNSSSSALNDWRLGRRSIGDRREQTPAPPTRTSDWPAPMDTNCSAAIRDASQHAPPETAPTTSPANARPSSDSSFTRVRFYSPAPRRTMTTATQNRTRPIPKPRRKVVAGSKKSADLPSSHVMTANDCGHGAVVVGGDGAESAARPITSDCEIPSGLFSRTSTCSVWNTPLSSQGDNGSNTFRTITSLSSRLSSHVDSLDDVSYTLAYASTTSSSTSPWFSEGDIVLSKCCEIEAYGDDDDNNNNDEEHALRAPKSGFSTQTPRCQMANNNNNRNNSGTADVAHRTSCKKLPRKHFCFTSDLKAH